MKNGSFSALWWPYVPSTTVPGAWHMALATKNKWHHPAVKELEHMSEKETQALKSYLDFA